MLILFSVRSSGRSARSTHAGRAVLRCAVPFLRPDDALRRSAHDDSPGSCAAKRAPSDLRQVTALSLGAFAYLVLIGAIVGYTAHIWLLRHCDPAKVATYAYVNPVVAGPARRLFRR